MNDKNNGQGQSSFTPEQIERLRSQLRGSALAPGDAGYDKARQTWNAETFDQRPALVVMPAVVADVQAAVGFARDHGLNIAVQGGGHGHPYPADVALLVNFANMHKITVDASTATARIEPGVLSKALLAAAQEKGLAPLTGFAGTVSTVGNMLGGGIGWLTRQYGVSASSIRALQVVTATGEIVEASVDSNPDLFWGLRGGGGNFGIVTALECDLYPIKEIFAGSVFYPLELGKQVLTAYFQWTENLPEELSTAVRIMQMPPSPALPPMLQGKTIVTVMACYTGDGASGEALLAPMRSIGAPLLDTFAVIPFAKVGAVANDPEQAPPAYLYNDGGAFQPPTRDQIESLVSIASDTAAGLFMTEIRQLGGALARQPVDAMAFNFREGAFYLNVMGIAPQADQLARGKATIDKLIAELEPAMTGQRLINFVDAGNAGPEITRSAYTPETFQRLRELKAKYDPQNVFRFNHNIPPA